MKHNNRNKKTYFETKPLKSKKKKKIIAGNEWKTMTGHIGLPYKICRPKLFKTQQNPSHNFQRTTTKQHSLLTIRKQHNKSDFLHRGKKSRKTTTVREVVREKVCQTRGNESLTVLFCFCFCF